MSDEVKAPLEPETDSGHAVEPYANDEVTASPGAVPPNGPMFPVPPAPVGTPAAGCGCGGGGGPSARSRGYVYAVGHIEARFPNVSVEKELAQAVSRADTQGMTDSQATHAVLTEPANRYLARQMCWVLGIEEIDAYLLVPRDSAEVDLLVETIRPTPRADDVDVVIGVLGDLAAPERCNGLALPEVGFEQIYSFDTQSFLDSIPCPPGRTGDAFQAAAQELIRRVLDLTDNTGSTDKHRALNYLTMRYPDIYSVAAEQFAKDASLTGVEASRSEVSRTRTLIDVVFTYTSRTNNVADRFAARVDVTEMFPFLTSPLSPYYLH